MKFTIGLTLGLVICFVLGAAQPNDEYAKACQCMQAESFLAARLMQDKPRHLAAMRRYEYWVSVMERFKP